MLAEVAVPGCGARHMQSDELLLLQRGFDGPMSCRVQQPISVVEQAGLTVIAPHGPQEPFA